jgi:hypothetical protein
MLVPMTQVPLPDVLPLPAPVWLLELLLLLTFVAHVVPMNFLLGGSLLAAVSHTRGAGEPRHRELARRIAQAMPVVIAFTITLGIAPLLFLQTLYGHLFYSSSILVARAWFLVIPLVIVGYYGAYWMRFRWDDLGGARTGLAWLLALVFAGVAFIYSNNLSLLMRPESWAAHYLADPGGGRLNLADPSLYPRYLHMVMGALAVASVWTMWLGVRRRAEDPDWSSWAVAHGARLFVGVTLVNLVVGSWFLFALPREITLLFMGRGALPTALLVGGLTCAMAAVGIVWQAGRSSRPMPLVVAGSILLLAAIGFMAVIRHTVRKAMLEPFFRLDELAVQPQWGVFAVFAALLLIGLAVVAWLVVTAARATPERG